MLLSTSTVSRQWLQAIRTVTSVLRPICLSKSMTEASNSQVSQLASSPFSRSPPLTLPRPTKVSSFSNSLSPWGMLSWTGNVREKHIPMALSPTSSGLRPAFLPVLHLTFSSRGQPISTEFLLCAFSTPTSCGFHFPTTSSGSSSGRTTWQSRLGNGTVMQSRRINDFGDIQFAFYAVQLVNSLINGFSGRYLSKSSSFSFSFSHCNSASGSRRTV